MREVGGGRVSQSPLVAIEELRAIQETIMVEED